MTMFIAHIKTPDGEIVNAGIMAPPGVETADVRSMMEQVVEHEFHGCELVDVHPVHDHEEPPTDHAPVKRREPYAIERMVMYGYTAMIAILIFFMRLNRNRGK